MLLTSLSKHSVQSRVAKQQVRDRGGGEFFQEDRRRLREMD
jgi:hypothetical protein